MKNIEVKSVVTVEAIQNALVSAFDPAVASTSYWCEISGNSKPAVLAHRLDEKHVYSYCDYPVNEGGALFLKDIEADEGKTYELGPKQIEAGVQAMAFGSPIVFARFVDNDTDGVDADIFVQYCVFGEIIYG